MRTVTIYGKPGCHLCDQALEMLLAVRRDTPFDLIERNILDDQETFVEYFESIPTVEIDGRFYCRFRIDPADFRKQVDKEQILSCEYEPKS